MTIGKSADTVGAGEEVETLGTRVEARGSNCRS